MLGFLVGVLGAFYSLLSGVLPQSPFRALQIGADIDTALGWLNWVVPVGDMLSLMGLWLAAILTAFIVKSLISRAFNSFEAVAK